MTAVPATIQVPVAAIPLTYARVRDPLPPMVRIGGVIGFLGLALTGLMLPITMNSNQCGDQYKLIVPTLVPSLQLICFGSSVTFVICCRHFAGRLRRGYMPMVAMHVLLLAVAVAQLTTPILLPAKQVCGWGRPAQIR